jgi:hypothetical protein
MNLKPKCIPAYWLILFMLCITNVTQAQKKMPDTLHRTDLAVMRSAIIPGWGQVYNKQWWKVPLIYTGLGLLGSAIVTNYNSYRQYLGAAIIGRKGTTSETDITQKNNPDYIFYKELIGKRYTQPVIEDIASNSQRNFQISILGVAGVWGIQMVDAYIYAKFRRSYSIDDNLGFTISPGVMTQPVYSANITTQPLLPCLKFSMVMK